jgi:hypothetical protein
MALCFCTLAAQASQVQISFPGRACSPSAQAIKFERYTVNNVSVEHRPGAIGLFNLTCPITPAFLFGNNWTLNLIYEDSNGTLPSAFVRAKLFRLPINPYQPNPPQTEPLLVATASLQFIGRQNRQYARVRIEIDRISVNQTVIFHGLYITRGGEF